MGEIERVQRIAAPVPVDTGRVHKADEARDGRQQHHPQQEADIIELTAELDEPVVPQSTQALDDEGHLDIAV